MAWWETLQDEKRPVHTVVAGSRFQDGTLRPESITGAGRTMFLCTQRGRWSVHRVTSGCWDSRRFLFSSGLPYFLIMYN